MQQLRHKNIVKLVEVIDSPDSDWVYLVLEYCSKGSLLTKQRSFEPLSQEVAKKYFRHLLKAVRYLHETVEVIHCDIKPQNILISGNDKVKLCDFGSAITLQDVQEHL